jgi:LAO/AO transport system kinase
LELQPDFERLTADVAAGDVRALSRALTWIESRAAGVDDLLAALFERRRGAWRIGVTGAPGTGKSTLAGKMIRELRREGRRVAVLAVDPTSPFSGGAILADRVRMLEHAEDPGVYIRSMASRGALGGLAPAAADALIALEASGFDTILIETVGVGQAEVDVSALADHVALVLTPGGGDDMQAMKAGVMEIADVYVINKSDLEGAETLERHLRALLSLRPEGDQAAPDIVRSVASNGSGVADLLERLRLRPRAVARTRDYWRRRLTEALTRALAERWLPRLAPPDALERAAADVAEGRLNPYRWVKVLVQRADKS